MSIDPASISVLLPDAWGGFTVCGLQDLYFRCDDETDYDELATNAGFDSSFGEKSLEHLRNKIRRVYDLNLTGNANAYWKTDS